MKTHLVFFPFLLTLLLAACSPGAAPSIRSVQLLPFTLSLKPGESTQVQAVVFGDAANKTVTWSSSNPEVIQVNASGLVTGLKTGQATITAISRADNSKKGSATATVTAPEVSNISIQLDSLTLGLGGKRTLSALVEGSSGVDTTVTWASSDEAIATVSSAGEVTALALGSTSITATAMADSSKSATIQVSVVTIALAYDPIAATVGRPVARNANLTGGNAPFTYEVVGTTLPAWLTLDAGNGALNGTPPAASPTAPFTIRVTDADGSTATGMVNVTVNAAPALAYPPTNTFAPGAAINIAPSINSGGTGTKTYSITPALPAGLSFDTNTGAISGSLATVQTISGRTVRVEDANGAVATSNSFSITIASSLSLTYTATRTLTVGRPIAEGTSGNYTRAISGLTGTATYSITSPTLPAWLAISPTTGVLSGSPTGAGSFPITVSVTDSSTASASSSFTLVVNAAPTLTFTQARALTAGRAVIAANYTLTPALGVAPYTYAATGIAATGLAISTTTGIISGAPSAAAVTARTLSFGVVATDANGATTSSTTVTFTVNAALSITTPYNSPLTVAIGLAVLSSAPVVAGGTGPLAFSVTPSTVTGLTWAIDATTGVVSVTRTTGTAGATISVTATDANGATLPLTLTGN